MVVSDLCVMVEAMAKARILAPWVGEGKESACYHVTSRVVDRVKRFDAASKDQFVKLMRTYEAFCGVRVLSYCVMCNHFHLLVEVPAAPDGGLSNEELLEKLRLIYSEEVVNQVAAQLQSLSGENVTAEGRKSHEAIRQSYFRRMWSLAEFMKVLKQRFSRWFNNHHQRQGTLWEERYNSSLVETGYAALVVSGYIDLNPVRAGMVDDPRHYRWSSYSKAIAGNQRARCGVYRVLEMSKQTAETDLQREARLNQVKRLKHYEWRTVASTYRVFLYEEGEEVSADPLTETVAGSKKAKRKGFSHELVKAEQEKKGQLGVATLLYHRVRHFIDGAVIGSRGFVDGVIGQLNEKSYWNSPRKTGGSAVSGSRKSLWSLRQLKEK